MGFGDEILGSGLARGAKARGKRIAFGDGRRILWGPWAEPIYRNNPNVARPGEHGASDIEWIRHHKGSRLYNSLNPQRTRWVWNMEFRAAAGEMFFDQAEISFADALRAGFVLIEPNVPRQKSVAPNKDWGLARYQSVADRLISAGHRIFQFAHGRDRLAGASIVTAPDYRSALSALARAALYIGPEGGLHHGAAAVGVPGVVLFGGFIPPRVTGYDTHTNLTGGVEACGSLAPCAHCRAAMDAISVDEVLSAALGILTEKTG